MAAPLRTDLTQLQSLREQIERAQRRRADTSVIPVAHPLSSLFLDGGLKPGSTYAVDSSVSLLLSLMSAPSAAGSWCAVVGLSSLSVEAIEKMGVNLDRLLLVPSPGPRWLTVTATLAEAIPIIAVRPPARPHDAEVSRLSARLRERGGVLLVLGEWPGAESELSLSESSWHGVNNGFGTLQSRTTTISARTRRYPTARRTRVMLPGPTGALSALPTTTATAASADTVSPARPRLSVVPR